MVRGEWSTISGDSEFWKKVGIASACLNFVVTAPLTMGLIVEDLEAEYERMKNNEKEGSLKGFDDPSGLFSSGVGGCLLFFATILIYGLPTILTLFAYFQIYTMFHSEIMEFKLVSFLLNMIFLLTGLFFQFVVAASFPVSLAQYSRGKDLRPALSPFDNGMTVLQMGADYWKKASGLAGGLIVMTAVVFQGVPFLVSLVLFLVLMGGAFVSTVLASRHALAEVGFNR